MNTKFYFFDWNSFFWRFYGLKFLFRYFGSCESKLNKIVMFLHIFGVFVDQLVRFMGEKCRKFTKKKTFENTSELLKYLKKRFQNLVLQFYKFFIFFTTYFFPLLLLNSHKFSHLHFYLALHFYWISQHFPSYTFISPYTYIWNSRVCSYLTLLVYWILN